MVALKNTMENRESCEQPNAGTIPEVRKQKDEWTRLSYRHKYIYIPRFVPWTPGTLCVSASTFRLAARVRPPLGHPDASPGSVLTAPASLVLPYYKA